MGGARTTHFRQSVKALEKQEGTPLSRTSQKQAFHAHPSDVPQGKLSVGMPLALIELDCFEETVTTQRGKTGPSHWLKADESTRILERAHESAEINV